MTVMRFFAALLLVVGLSGTGQAQAEVRFTGNHLREACTALMAERPYNEMAAGECVGFLSGFQQSYELVMLAFPKQRRPVCIPPTASIGQLAGVFLKYAKDNPETLHLHAGALCFDAFLAAFPCTSL